jgi:hypothetical protein
LYHHYVWWKLVAWHQKTCFSNIVSVWLLLSPWQTLVMQLFTCSHINSLFLMKDVDLNETVHSIVGLQAYFYFAWRTDLRTSRALCLD